MNTRIKIRFFFKFFLFSTTLLVDQTVFAASQLHLDATAGMFKLLNGKASFTLKVSSGAVLIEAPNNNYKLKGTWKLTRKFKSKCIYTGNGSITFNGNFQTVQCMGENILLNFSGKGKYALYGGFARGILGRKKIEADKNFHQIFSINNKKQKKWPEYTHIPATLK